MSSVLDPVLGRIDASVLDRKTFFPGSTVAHESQFQAVITAVVRDGRTRRPTQAVYGFGMVPTDGLHGRWRCDEGLQRAYDTPEAFVRSFGDRLRWMARHASRWPLSPYAGGNERVDNGAKMAMKLLYNVSSPDQTAGYPVYMALSNQSGFAAAHGDLSLGSATHLVTTNEYTNHGLARTGALTPTPTTPSTLDGQYTIVESNVFTETATGPDVVYGGGMFDNTVASAASNLFMEYAFSSVSLLLNDTVTVTYTAKG